MGPAASEAGTQHAIGSACVCGSELRRGPRPCWDAYGDCVRGRGLACVLRDGDASTRAAHTPASTRRFLFLSFGYEIGVVHEVYDQALGATGR